MEGKVHDSIRYDCAKNGTYDKILKSAKDLVKKRGDKSYYIRGTFTSRNLDFSRIFSIWLIWVSKISIEPVVGAKEDFHIRKEHLPRILKEYENWLLIILTGFGIKPLNFII